MADPEDKQRGRVRLQAADTNSAIPGRIRAAKKVIDLDGDVYDQVNDYFEGRQQDPYIPTTSTQETREIRARSVYNLMPLAVAIPSQFSFVDGYRRGGDLFPAEWKNCWDRCNMPAKQTMIYKASLKYGAAWVGLENLGVGKPDIKLYSTRDTVGMFHDPVNDLHPAYLFSIKSYPLDKDNPGRAVYMDDERIIHFDYTSDKEFVEREGENYEHDLKVCPAVRYLCEMDDVGNVRGMIEPLIPMQDAINQSKFNLLVVQQFASFKVRWAAGMTGEPRLDSNGDIMRDDTGQVMYQPIAVTPSRFLSSEAPDAKFGTLDETPLDGFIQALEMEIKHFATAAQVPPHSLLGNMSNLSAETLVAAMGQTVRFTHVLKTSWGQSHEALLRLVALDIGEDVGEDYQGEVRWRDMSDQSFTGVMDGLGKGAQMLEMPKRFLWSKFPGVTHGDLEEMDKLHEEEQREMQDQAVNEDPRAAAAREYRPPKRPERGGVGNQDDYSKGTL